MARKDKPPAKPKHPAGAPERPRKAARETPHGQPQPKEEDGRTNPSDIGDSPPAQGVRLQKVLAQAGVASRRAAEELIRQGRIEVNGRTVTELGVRVDPLREEIRLDGKPVSLLRQMIYFAFYKPRQCVTTAKDPQGRKTVFDFLPDTGGRVFPVGRLDYDAEGLLLFTNDGALANRLLHPRYGVSKTYEVKVKGHPDQVALGLLRSGVVIEEGTTAPAEVRLLRTLPKAAWIEIVLHQGWNRQIKRMGDAVGHPVLKIKRIAYGPVKLGRLVPGKLRLLEPGEVRMLYRDSGFEEE